MYCIRQIPKPPAWIGRSARNKLVPAANLTGENPAAHLQATPVVRSLTTRAEAAAVKADSGRLLTSSFRFPFSYSKLPISDFRLPISDFRFPTSDFRLPTFLFLFLLQSCTSGKFLLPDRLPEVSGLHYAGPDSLYWHNDSGDRARLLLTDRRGNIRREIEIPGAANRDWEDLTGDDAGNLYIGDFGNNANRRRDLTIYRFDPAGGSLDSITFRYPDQREFPPPPERANFDMEAFFWHEDSLHLFSKNRLGKGNYFTKHYVLPAEPGDYTAVLRDSLFLNKRVVTGAAISDDGQTVALVAYYFRPLLGIFPLSAATVFTLTDFTGDHFLEGTLHRRRIPKGLPPTQYEAVDFVAPDTVMVASEKTVLFRQKARVLRVLRVKGRG